MLWALKIRIARGFYTFLFMVVFFFFFIFMFVLRLSWVVFSPVVFAPIIPLTRVLLQRRGFSSMIVQRATLGMIGVALVHGIFVMSSISTHA